VFLSNAKLNNHFQNPRKAKDMPKREDSLKDVLKWRIMDLKELGQIRSNKAITSRLGKIIRVGALKQNRTPSA
jgi:hypothetical protein